MGDDKKTKSASLGWMFWAFVWGAVGYLVYGTTIGAITLALFSAITSLTAILGIIPVVGIWFTFITTNYVKHWLLQYITMSWAVALIFWIALAGSTLLTLLILIFIIAKVID